MVTLRAANLDDRAAVYQWMARSDLTSSMMGPPNFPDAPVPTWEAFISDYLPHFFDGSEIDLGRSFIIEVNKESIGHANYARHASAHEAIELDIWMRSSSDCGRGYGTEALRLLMTYVAEHLEFEKFIIRPSARNHRAVASYRKLGFLPTELSLEEQSAVYGSGDYFDTVTLELASRI